MTPLRCGEICNDIFVANFLLNVSVKSLKIGHYLAKLWTRVWCFFLLDHGVQGLHSRAMLTPCKMYDWLTLVLRLGVKKTPGRFCIIKNSFKGWVEPLWISWIWNWHKMQQSDRRLVISVLEVVAWRQTRMNYFETCEVLRSCWLIQPNASKVSIILILAAKAQFFDKLEESLYR